MKPKTIVSLALIAVVAATALYWFNYNPTSNSKDGVSFRAGAILALTGPNAEYGIQSKRGIELAIKDILSENPSARIIIQYEDSESTPTKSVTAYQKLVAKDGVKLIFGNASFLAKAVSPLAENDDVLFIALGTTMPGLVEGKSHTMRHFPTSSDLALLVAKYAKSNFDRVAVLYVNDEYGNSAYLDFRKNFEEPKKAITFSEGFDAKNSDVRSLVDKALHSGGTDSPQAVYVPGYGPAFSAIVKQIREMEPQISILGDLALVNANVRSELGRSAEGIVVPALASDAGKAMTADAATFIRNFNEQFGIDPDILVVTAYDAFRIAYTAVQEAGESPENVKRLIIENSPHKSINGPVSYTKDGDSQLAPSLLIVRDGRLSILE